MIALLLVVGLATPAHASPTVASLVDGYVERYFQTFPTRATEAGRHDLDTQLEDLTPAAVDAWLTFNRETRAALVDALASGDISDDDRLDAEAVTAQIDREVHEFAVRKRPARDPLFWTSILANATVFLLVRDDQPVEARVNAATSRARLLGRLARQARQALSTSDPSHVVPEFCRLAARQSRSAATFYGDGFPRTVAGLLSQSGGQENVGTSVDNARDGGRQAASALAELADFLEQLAARATGSPRLGDDYATVFRLGTGISEPVSQVLARAEADLAAKRRETAEYGRSVWHELVPGETPPADDATLVRRLFDRVEADRDTEIGEYVAGWRRNTAELERFVRQKGMMTLPDPLTLIIDTSPSYFAGQSVGGVYPAGPYAPEGKTLLFVPVPADTATPAERDAFYRDFNRSFNRMIAPHELIPGHYVQLKYAARHPRKVRALFADAVYVEGWGTFCERLLLDQGWGGPLPRLAHLKKQLENIARAIVDVRVHTQDLSQDAVMRFVKEEAFQGDQLARNMWVRSIRTAPQITTYYLGYREVARLYDQARRAQGAAFDLRTFLDGMMELGPVPVRHYERISARGAAQR